MAIRKIEMRPEGTNDYADVIYPMTSIDIIDGYGHYAVASGTNTYTVSIPRITSLIAGTKVVVKFTNANNSTSNININGLGAKSIIKPGGGNPNIKANGVYTLIYDGTSFQLQGEGGEYGTALASDVLQGKTVGTDNGIITGTIPIRGASTITPSASNQTISAGQYLSGIQTISGVSVPVGNVLTGTTIAGQTGTMPNRGAPAQTLTTQGGQYNLPSGYYSGGSVKAQFANLTAGNIKAGVNIGGVAGNYSGPNPVSGVANPITEIIAFKRHEGSYTTDSFYPYIKVNQNFGFIPTTIICYTDGLTYLNTTIYSKEFNASDIKPVAVLSAISTSSYTIAFANGGGLSVTSSGFTLPVSSYNSKAMIRWIAYP